MSLPRSSRLDFGRANAPAQSASRERYQIDGVIVEYILKRSQRRRSITLTINEDGLRVGAPWRASQSRIDKLLARHAQWISLKLAQWQARRPAPFSWQAGAPVMMLGEPLILTLTNEKSVTRRDGDRLCVGVGVNTGDDPATLAKQVTAWLRDTAQNWFEQRSAHFARVLDVRAPSIRLSNARTRWGTCHPDGRVHLNWRLIQTPPALIDYVVVHELAHLREPNHSARFWAWVERAMPDYKARRRTLRLDGHRFLLA